MLGNTEDFGCKEASEGTDMSSGHRGQYICSFAHSLLDNGRLGHRGMVLQAIANCTTVGAGSLWDGGEEM
jgi:hypothetical protein